MNYILDDIFVKHIIPHFTSTEVELIFILSKQHNTIIKNQHKYIWNLFWYHKTSFHPNGNKKFHATYKDDYLEGNATIWYENGYIKRITSYKDGLREGEQTQWSSEGNLICKDYYINNKRHGTFTKWNKNGQLHLKQYYIDGVPSSIDLYDKGKPILNKYN